MTTQAAAEVGDRARVEDVFRANPSPPRHLHTPAQTIERGHGNLDNSSVKMIVEEMSA